MRTFGASLTALLAITASATANDASGVAQCIRDVLVAGHGTPDLKANVSIHDGHPTVKYHYRDRHGLLTQRRIDVWNKPDSDGRYGYTDGWIFGGPNNGPLTDEVEERFQTQCGAGSVVVVP